MPRPAPGSAEGHAFDLCMSNSLGWLQTQGGVRPVFIPRAFLGIIRPSCVFEGGARMIAPKEFTARRANLRELAQLADSSLDGHPARRARGRARRLPDAPQALEASAPRCTRCAAWTTRARRACGRDIEAGRQQTSRLGRGGGWPWAPPWPVRCGNRAGAVALAVGPAPAARPSSRPLGSLSSPRPASWRLTPRAGSCSPPRSRACRSPICVASSSGNRRGTARTSSATAAPGRSTTRGRAAGRLHDRRGGGDRNPAGGLPEGPKTGSSSLRGRGRTGGRHLAPRRPYVCALGTDVRNGAARGRHLEGRWGGAVLNAMLLQGERRRLDPETAGDHIDTLFRAACAMCGSRQLAEDLVQETYVKVLSRPRFLRKDDDLGYLIKALRNTWYSHLRNELVRREATASGGAADEQSVRDGRDDPESSLEAAEVLDAARGCRSVPGGRRGRRRGGSQLRGGRSRPGGPEGTMMSRLYRGREQVALALGPDRSPRSRRCRDRSPPSPP